MSEELKRWIESKRAINAPEGFADDVMDRVRDLTDTRPTVRPRGWNAWVAYTSTITMAAVAGLAFLARLAHLVAPFVHS